MKLRIVPMAVVVAGVFLLQVAFERGGEVSAGLVGKADQNP